MGASVPAAGTVDRIDGGAAAPAEEPSCSRAVLEDDDLLTEILLHPIIPTTLVNSVIVSTRWLAPASDRLPRSIREIHPTFLASTSTKFGHLAESTAYQPTSLAAGDNVLIRQHDKIGITKPPDVSPYPPRPPSRDLLSGDPPRSCLPSTSTPMRTKEWKASLHLFPSASCRSSQANGEVARTASSIPSDPLRRAEPRNGSKKAATSTLLRSQSSPTSTA
ncbi:hypothetical protein ZWY2020_035800 [Hordeum vulgare]|nr:hypothetical protein ZWY2020_035800 [Hordeum vulgare]